MEEQTTTPSQNKKPLSMIVIFIVVALLVITGITLFLTPKEKALVTPGTVESLPTQQPTSMPTQTENTASPITVEGGNFYFKPNEIHVKKGENVKITFTNKGGMHDFVIDELSVRTKQIQNGQSETVELTADKTGTFEYYCSVGMHRKMGMVGKLIVE